MTPTEFVHFLDGYFRLSNPKSIPEEQTGIIKDALGFVLHALAMNRRKELILAEKTKAENDKNKVKSSTSTSSLPVFPISNASSKASQGSFQNWRAPNNLAKTAPDVKKLVKLPLTGDLVKQAIETAKTENAVDDLSRIQLIKGEI